MHHGRKDVFGADQASVEHGESGNHEKDQRGRSKHPSGGAGIDWYGIHSASIKIVGSCFSTNKPLAVSFIVIDL